MPGSTFVDADEPTRRQFVSDLARVALGVGTLPWLSRAAAAQPPASIATARSVIYLYASGGMSHLDTFDPKPGAGTQGPTEVIGSRVDGIQVAAELANVAKVMDRICLLSGMQSTQGAHAQGRYFLHTGYELRGTIRHPSLGAWLSRLGGRRNPTLPPHVAIGGDIYCASGGFLEPQHFPLPIGDPEAGLQWSERPEAVNEDTFQRRLARLHEMNAAFAEHIDHPQIDGYAEVYDAAVKLMESKDLAAFDLARESDRVRDGYGHSRFGQGCLLARRLVERGVRFVEVVSDGWDTHNDNFDELAEKVPVLDRALAALLLDLEARGLLEDTLVVLTSEFGRTPDIRPERNGRDHYPKAFTCLLAGGGIRGGMRWGRTDAEGREVVENPTTIPDLNATIATALGLPLDLEITSPSGRPFTVANHGKPVLEVFA